MYDKINAEFVSYLETLDAPHGSVFRLAALGLSNREIAEHLDWAKGSSFPHGCRLTIGYLLGEHDASRYETTRPSGTKFVRAFLRRCEKHPGFSVAAQARLRSLIDALPTQEVR